MKVHPGCAPLLALAPPLPCAEISLDRLKDGASKAAAKRAGTRYWPDETLNGR